MTKAQQLLASLTIEQAREWNRREDKLLYVMTTITEPAGLSMQVAEQVEAAFEKMLAA